MATVALSYSAVQTMTVTNLHSNSNSATNAWTSAVVDNTTDLYLEALVQVVLDYANTAPANDKVAYVYAYGGVDTNSVLSGNVTGTEGDLTIPTIVSNPQAYRLIGIVPYTTQDEVMESQPMSVAAAFGGMLPPYWGIVIVNYSGAALGASGNTVKWRGIKATVA